MTYEYKKRAINNYGGERYMQSPVETTIIPLQPL